MDKKDFTKIINEVLDSRREKDLSHSEHHEFIERMIKKEERRQEIWDKVKAQVLGWGIVAIIGSIGAWILGQR